MTESYDDYIERYKKRCAETIARFKNEETFMNIVKDSELKRIADELAEDIKILEMSIDYDLRR